MSLRKPPTPSLGHGTGANECPAGRRGGGCGPSPQPAPDADRFPGGRGSRYSRRPKTAFPPCLPPSVPGSLPPAPSPCVALSFPPFLPASLPASLPPSLLTSLRPSFRPSRSPVPLSISARLPSRLERSASPVCAGPGVCVPPPGAPCWQLGGCRGPGGRATVARRRRGGESRRSGVRPGRCAGPVFRGTGVSTQPRGRRIFRRWGVGVGRGRSGGGVGWWEGVRALPGLLPQPRRLPANPQTRACAVGGPPAGTWAGSGIPGMPRKEWPFSAVWSLSPGLDLEGRNPRPVSPVAGAGRRHAPP